MTIRIAPTLAEIDEWAIQYAGSSSVATNSTVTSHSGCLSISPTHGRPMRCYGTTYPQQHINLLRAQRTSLKSLG